MADDALQSAAPEGIVERDGNRNGCPLLLKLHDPMASALTDCYKTVPFKNPANFGAGEDPQLTQRAPQPA